MKVVKHLLLSFFKSCMSSMTFLPKELSSSDEWSRMLELPSHNVRPLIQLNGKISVTLNPFSIGRVHNGLTGWSDRNMLCKITLSWFCNPGNFRSKTFNMIFFDFKWFFRDKHWEVCILNSICFNKFIEEILNFFPNRVGPGSQNIATWNIIVFNKSWFYYDFLIPPGEVSFFLCINAKQVDFFLFLLLFFLLRFLFCSFLLLLKSLN